ncbi:MAG: hypothetical protein MUE59_13190 [Thiobacillaceae bacterium]|jgi:hypothetical protein|nr:hypothetical protein [Thiobacillaceae bacterium]
MDEDDRVVVEVEVLSIEFDRVTMRVTDWLGHDKQVVLKRGDTVTLRSQIEIIDDVAFAA